MLFLSPCLLAQCSFREREGRNESRFLPALHTLVSSFVSVCFLLLSALSLSFPLFSSFLFFLAVFFIFWFLFVCCSSFYLFFHRVMELG